MSYAQPRRKQTFFQVKLKKDKLPSWAAKGLNVPKREGKSYGVNEIPYLLYGTNKSGTFKSEVVAQKTQAKGVRIYWFQAPKGKWYNTDLKGIREGVVIHEEDL